MMFTHKYLMTVCCAAVLAFGLAACGSSGDDDKVVTTTPVVPVDPVDPVDPASTDDEIAAATKAAGTKATAIGGEAGETGEADDGPGGVDADTNHLIAIARDRDGTTVTITVDGAADDPKFAQMMDFGDGRTMHVRDNGMGEEEVVIVSTDIDEPTATPFAMVNGQTFDVSTNTMNDEPDPTFEAFAIAENDDDVRALVKSAAFTSNTVATLTFDNNDTETDDDEAFETAGTYNGAMGTYRCNGTAVCTVTLDADGAITAMNDGWIFTPATGATSDVADADYLHYGFWLKKTTDADGVLTYDEVETFAGSSIPASSSVTEVDGSATYEGGAVGVYVRNVFDSEGEIDTATSGHFRADAMLTATFGQTTTNSIVPNLLNTLSGTIDNFVLQHGEENEWSVNLQGPIDTADGTASGTANGGGDPGSFTATFHGDVMAVEGVVPLPSSVVGEFDANFSNGSVAGGFGARK